MELDDCYHAAPSLKMIFNSVFSIKIPIDFAAGRCINPQMKEIKVTCNVHNVAALSLVAEHGLNNVSEQGDAASSSL